MSHPADIQADIEIALERLARVCGDADFRPETIGCIAIDMFIAARKDRFGRGDPMSQSATWDRPDFADPRFAIERVGQIAECRHEGCERLPEFRVEYTMRREPWTYEYECGYCGEHMPQAAIDWLGEN